MRVMMIVRSTEDTEAGVPPTAEALDQMGRFNEEMVRAGIMLDGAGLRPSSAGAKVVFNNGATRVIDGPFAEAKELIAGYWLLEVKSLDEAIEWARRCPAPTEGDGGAIEIRPLYEAEDFGEGPAIDRHIRLREEMSKK